MAEANDFSACGVCGRTILRGERVVEYATPDGARVAVCALCKPSAEGAGWVPAEHAGAGAATRATRRRGLGLRQRLSKVSEAARGLAARPPREEPEAPARGRSGAEKRTERQARREGSKRTGRQERQARPEGSKRTERQEGQERQEGPRRAQREAREQRSRGTERGRHPDPAPAAEQPRRRQRPPSPERRLRIGVEAFNASTEPRKVAGLIRALGEPRVAVRPNSGDAVIVTVAWELSWYQWEVSPDDSGEPVRETGKGKEVAELGERDRTWNASVTTEGTVQLELAAARRSSPESG